MQGKLTLSLHVHSIRKQVSFLLQAFQKGFEWHARTNQGVIEILVQEPTKEYLTEV